MDQNKKVALLKWLDALSVCSITTFEDLRDVAVVTDILCTCGDLLPERRSLDTLEKRLQALQTYLEGCYHQSFEDCSLINFQLLASNVRGDLFEFEMGKLLLALLGCVVQDKAREKFIEPALTMDSQSQYELKEMIECLLFVSDTDTRIPDDFAEVLKRRTESSSHRDAALFFKLVADGGTVSPQRTRDTPVPSASCSVNEPKFAMYSSSPQAGNTSGINIRDISSPLRVMSISSPVTPLGALMYSPQLAQKIVTREMDKRTQQEALLRTKIQEYKRLDLEHKNEIHLRQELEYDLEQYGKTMLEKENKIRDLERQLGDVRRMRDSVDELEVLRSERERLDNHVRDLQTRLNEHNDMREQNQMLECELSNMMKEQTAATDELKMMDLLKQSSEKYRIQSHKQQLTITELEASLEHRSRETEQLHAQLEEAHNMRHACLEKYNTVKREKEELEEMFSDNQGGMSAGVPMFTGESMNVVTEKRLSELQTEYDQMRSSWIDPIQHNSVLKQLQQEQQAKSAYEDQFKATKNQLMTCESDNEKLNMSIRQFQCRIDTFESDIADSDEKFRGLEAQVDTLQNTEENLQATVRHLKQDFSKLQTEMMLTHQELDDEKRVSEDRRGTIAQLDEVRTQSMKSEQQLKQSEQSLKQMVSILEIAVEKMKLEKILSSDEIKALKERAADLNEEIVELTNKLENERSISANVVKKLNSDLAEEHANNVQIQSNLKKLSFEYSEYKLNMETKVEEITGTLSEVSKEKNAVDLDLRRLQLELDNTKETSQAKYDRLDRQLTEQENQLKQELHDLKKKLEDLERSEQSLKQVVSILEIAVDKMKCETILNSDEIKALKERAANLNEEIAELTNKLEKERSISTNVVEKLNSNLAEEHVNNEQIQSNLKKLTCEYSEYKLNMETKVEEITGTLSEVSKEKNAVDLDLRRLQLELDNTKETSQAKYDRLDRQLTEQENQLKQELHDLKRKNEEVERKRQSFKDDLQMSSNIIKEQKDEMQKCNKTIDELKSQVACVTGDAETASRMALEYELQIKFLNEKVTVDQEQSASSFKSLSDQYATLLGQYKEEKYGLNKQIEEMKCQISHLKEDLDSKHIQNSKDKVGLNKKIDDMKSDNESRLCEVSQQHEQSIDKLESEITKLKNNADEMKNSHSNEISELKKAIDSMESERVKLELFNTERISTMSTQLDYFKEVEKCHNSAYSSLETDYDSMKNMIKQREEVREELEKVIGEKEAEVTELRDQVAQLKDQLNAQLGDAERKVKTLNDEKDEAESRCAKYKAQCESEVAELKDRLVEVESYWRSQCEQLEEEYAAGTQELREAHEKQVEEMEKMSEDKDLYSNSQREAYQLKTHCLEKVLHDREVDIESVTSSLLKVSNEMKNIQSELANRNEQLQKMRDELKEQQLDYQQRLCYMKEKEMTLMEEKEMELKLLKETHKKYVEQMEKVCSDKDLYVGSQKKDYEEKKDALEKALHDTAVKIEGVNLALLNESDEKQHVQSELNNLKEQFEKLQEEMSVEIKLQRETHEKEIEHVEKVSAEKDLYIRNQKLEWEQKMHTLEKTNSNYERKVSELQSEMKEHGVNHQHLVSDIEENQNKLWEEKEMDLKLLKEAHKKYINKMEKAYSDKDIYVCSLKEDYKEKTDALEKALHDKAVENESMNLALLNESNEKHHIQRELNNLNEQIEKLQEEMTVELTLQREAHEIHVEHMEKVSEEKDLYIGNQKLAWEQKMNTLETANSDSERKMSSELDDKSEQLQKLVEEMKEQQLNYQQLVCDMEEKLVKLREGKNMEIKLLQEAHTKYENQMEKISSDKDLYMGNQKEDYEQKMNVIEKENVDFERKVSQLQSEMKEQGLNYQQMFCDMEEKLVKLREGKEMEIKLLQEAHMKYENQMEKISSDKDLYMGNQKEDYEQKMNVIEKENVDFERKVSQLQSEMKEQGLNYQQMFCDMEEKLVKLREGKEMEIKLLQEAHMKYENQMEKISSDKDLYMGNQKEDYEQKMNVIEKANGDVERKVSQLQSEMKEQGMNYQQMLCDMEEKLVQLREGKEMEIKLLQEAHTKYENQMEKISSDKDLYMGNQKVDYEQKISVIEKANGDFERKVSQLQSEMKEQGMNYQQMLCDMEEKLGGEVTVLKERLSQMKCQYETLIESKEKDMKKTTEEWQSKLNAIAREKDLTEQQCAAEREQNNKVQSELMILSSKVTVYEKMLSESDSVQTELNQKLESRAENMNKLDEELSSCQQCVKSMEFELMRCREELSGFRESMSHEKGEKEELCRRIEYTQERNDTLTGELSSQQQQLAAVEEEKRQLDIQINQLVATQEDTRVQLHEQMNTEKCMMELEKEELERQLQSSQKCYEAVNKSKMELQHEAEKMRAEIEQLQEKNRGLEQRLLAFLEQERSLKEENQRQRDRSTELNNNLQAHIRQCDALQDSNTKVKQDFDQVTRKLREEKTALEIEAATLSEVEEKLKMTEAERARLQEINGKYNIHYNMKKDIISKQAEQMDDMNKQLDYYKRVEDKLTKEVAPLSDKLNIEVAKNKKLFKQIQSLETQNDFADRKLREYKLQLEKPGSIYLGDSSEFNRMLASRENCEDASFMENHPSSVPQNISLFEQENDDTLTPGTRNSLSRRRIGKSVSSSTVCSAQSADTVSIGSASSLAYRLRSRESAVSLNRSISSFDSARSNIPKGTGGIFHCEDEPLQLEWGRLGELSRRNTMCPSHLKTSYPVETQRYNPIRFQEDALRASTIDNQTVINHEQQPGSGRKRKQGWDSNDSGSDSADSKTSKQAKTGCVYQKPGPPTPSTSRRSSKGSRSPRKGSNSRSPRSPITRSRRTPRRTPKANTPKRSAIMDTRSLNGSGKKSTKRDSVAFNVGFSPLSMGRSNRLTRQQAFIQKQPPSVSQVSNLISKFEKRSTPSTLSLQNMSQTVTPCCNLRSAFEVAKTEHSRARHRSNAVGHGVDASSAYVLNIDEQINNCVNSCEEENLVKTSSMTRMSHLNTARDLLVPKAKSETDLSQQRRLQKSQRIPPKIQFAPSNTRRTLVYTDTPSVNPVQPCLRLSPATATSGDMQPITILSPAPVVSTNNKLCPRYSPMVAVSIDAQPYTRYSSATGTAMVTKPCPRSASSMATQTYSSNLEMSNLVRSDIPGIGRCSPPRLSIAREEHIYDEIHDVVLNFNPLGPQPLPLQVKGHMASTPEPLGPRALQFQTRGLIASTPELNQHFNISLTNQNAPTNPLNASNISNYSARVDDNIRHLHNSPDYSRRLIRPRLRTNTPRLPNRSVTSVNHTLSSVSEYRGTPKKARLPPITPVRIHHIPHMEPGPAFQQHDDSDFAVDGQRKQQAGNTPKKLLRSLITRIRNPSIRKAQRNQQEPTDDEDDIMF